MDTFLFLVATGVLRTGTCKCPYALHIPQILEKEMKIQELHAATVAAESGLEQAHAALRDAEQRAADRHAAMEKEVSAAYVFVFG